MERKGLWVSAKQALTHTQAHESARRDAGGAITQSAFPLTKFPLCRQLLFCLLSSPPPFLLHLLNCVSSSPLSQRLILGCSAPSPGPAPPSAALAFILCPVLLFSLPRCPCLGSLEAGTLVVGTEVLDRTGEEMSQLSALSSR